MMVETYIGKHCEKHNTNIRRRKSRVCVECHLANRRREGKKRNRNKADSMIFSRLRKLRLLQAIPKWANRNKIRKIYESREEGQHVDHIIPLKGICPTTKGHTVCGLHWEDNLRVINSNENDSKWAWFIDGDKGV